MLNKFIKIYIFSVILLSDFILFAQDDDPGAYLEDQFGNTDNTVEAPINSKLILLLITGIAFSFYYFKNNREQQA